jgi:hypothetical protein
MMIMAQNDGGAWTCRGARNTIAAAVLIQIVARHSSPGGGSNCGFYSSRVAAELVEGVKAN